MKTLSTLLAGLVLAAGLASADPALDESTVRAISDEMLVATKKGDMSVFKKYLYEGSRIVIDTDPSNSAGLEEIPYDQFMGLTAMALGAMQHADIHSETLSIDVDEANNRATISEKTIAVLDMMGVKVRDESISTTTYGVVGGKIRVLSTEDQLVSSDVIPD